MKCHHCHETTDLEYELDETLRAIILNSGENLVKMDPDEYLCIHCLDWRARYVGLKLHWRADPWLSLSESQVPYRTEAPEYQSEPPEVL